MLVVLGAVDAGQCVGMGVQALDVDLRTAFDADAEFAAVHASERRRDLGYLRTRLVAQRVDHLAVFELLGPLLRVGLVAAPKIRGNALEPHAEFRLLLLQAPPQLIVGRHTDTPPLPAGSPSKRTARGAKISTST